jgi:hypothetical protein
VRNLNGGLFSIGVQHKNGNFNIVHRS